MNLRPAPTVPSWSIRLSEAKLDALKKRKLIAPTSLTAFKAKLLEHCISQFLTSTSGSAKVERSDKFSAASQKAVADLTAEMIQKAEATAGMHGCDVRASSHCAGHVEQHHFQALQPNKRQRCALHWWTLASPQQGPLCIVELSE